MGILWETYDRLKKFWLFDAACFWLEIDPSKDNIKDPSLAVQRMMSLIEEHCFVFYPGQIRDCSKLIKDPKTGLITGRRIEVPSFGYTSIEIENQIPVVARDNLIRMANNLSQTPKFLFPEMRDGEKWSEEGTCSKESYQKLLQALLKTLNVDPTARDAVGKIHQKVQESGSSLSDVTIRKILDEIEPSRKGKQK